MSFLSLFPYGERGLFYLERSFEYEKITRQAMAELTSR